MDSEISTIWGEMEWPHDWLHDKCMELLARVEALEEELHGPKPGPITADDLLCMMQDVYEGLSEHGIYIN